MENSLKILTIEKIEKVIDSSESVQKLIECIKSLELMAISIGEGGNAVVYAMPGTSFEKVCLKKIKKNPQILYNNIDEEHDFQISAKKAGVRTPFSLLSIKTNDDEYLVMEKIEGNSVGEIIKNPQLLPKNFDPNIFCNSLDDQIKKMHNENIYHRDLHDKNVMIDKEGLPVIIDFGTATRGTGSDFTYEESVSVYDEKKGRYFLANGFFKDDLEMVRNIKSSIRNLYV
jgi:tRNA A-37 threonylcarbamoyl transferase component Bud32